MFKQIIVTGLNVTSNKASEIRAFCTLQNVFSVNWCHPDGVIGYIDSSEKPIDSVELKKDLESLVRQFPDLELGISLMSGPPKSYNFPICQFLVSGGKVKKQDFPHIGHKAPKRYKP